VAIPETIFEHEVTKLEVEILSSCSPHKGLGNKEIYLKYCDTDTINADLYRLFTLRNEFEIAEVYLKKIKDPVSVSSVYFF
jgi:hypothetical protein